MNAQSTTPGPIAGGLAAGRPRLGRNDERLAGLGNFFAKEMREWFRTRRAFWTAVAAQALLLLGVLAMRVFAAFNPHAEGVNLSASFNMYNAGWETILPLFVIFSTMGFLVGERETRTLAWSLSMPLSRGAVLAAKLAGTIVALGILTWVLPLATTLVAVRLAYGEFPDAASTVGPFLTGIALSIFLIVLNLTTSSFFRSQRSVTAIALCAALAVPMLIENLWKAASPWYPMAIEFWIKGLANREAVNWITPVVYVAVLAGLLVAAQARFSRDEV
jgi:hypothetical protein